MLLYNKCFQLSFQVVKPLRVVVAGNVERILENILTFQGTGSL